jgi:hypothetical protein
LEDENNNPFDGLLGSSNVCVIIFVGILTAVVTDFTVADLLMLCISVNVVFCCLL